MSLLKIQNLTVGFNNPIFKNINLELKENALTCLMGINGIGKSCLIRTLSKMLPKLSGEVLFFEKKIQEIQINELSKLLSIVTTEKIAIDYMTVFELVLVGRSPYVDFNENYSEEDKKKTFSTLELFGLTPLAHSYFEDLSDGQKQKAIIARAINQETPILILDEPTTFLDIPAKKELMKILKKISQEQKISILMSTHELELVERFADDVWILGKDDLCLQDTPENLKQSGVFKKVFDL